MPGSVCLRPVHARRYAEARQTCYAVSSSEEQRKKAACVTPSSFRPVGVRRLLAYGFAFLFGVALMLWCFPAAVWQGKLPQAPQGAGRDFLQHVAGQLYILARTGHVALCSHWILLLAIGLYFRAVASPPSRKALVLLVVLTVLALFIHPYLMLMVFAVLAAVPTTLLLRNLSARESMFPLVACAMAALGVAGAGAVFGYWGVDGVDGYDIYSMNLGSPFYPAWSALFPHLDPHRAEATSGQYEGYQYLGAGLLVALASLLVTRRGRGMVMTACRNHAGVLLCSLVLTVLALSNRVFLFHHQVFFTTHLPPGASQLRAAGRFFWPVTYFLMIGGVYGVCRTWPRGGPVLLLALALLQWCDAASLRQGVHATQLGFLQQESPMDGKLDVLIKKFHNIEIHPRMECTGEALDSTLRVIYLAAAQNIPVNTMYQARPQLASSCEAVKENAHSLDNETLLVLTGGKRVAHAHVWQMAGDMSCGALEDKVICARNPALIADAAAPLGAAATSVMGQTTRTTSSGLRDNVLLLQGWSYPEDWGTWSDGPTASLAILMPSGLHEVQITLRLHCAPGPVERRQVAVTSQDGTYLAKWTVSAEPRHYTVRVPVPAGKEGVFLNLRIEKPARVGLDPRWLGVGIESVRVDNVPSVTE